MNEYTDLLEHGFSVSEAAEALDLAVAAEIERRRARAARTWAGGGRGGIGCDGIVYKGWMIARRWNAAKGFTEFVATNPDVPGVEIAGGDTEWKAKQAIDRRSRVQEER